MSSNLPPGVSENMIPGNRPEDLEYEHFWDTLIDRVGDLSGAPSFWYEQDWLITVVDMAAELSYDKGMADGRMEEQMSQMAEECIRCGYAHSVQSPCVVD